MHEFYFTITNRNTAINDTNEFREATADELHVVAGGNVLQEMMSSVKLMGEILSNVSKTRPSAGTRDWTARC